MGTIGESKLDFVCFSEIKFDQQNFVKFNETIQRKIGFHVEYLLFVYKLPWGPLNKHKRRKDGLVCTAGLYPGALHYVRKTLDPHPWPDVVLNKIFQE